MEATPAERLFSDPGWLFEIKMDGYRLQVRVDAGSVRLFTRSGADASRLAPFLLADTGWIDARDAVVDGELVALDADGRPDFSLLQGRLAGELDGPLAYVAFDVLQLDGASLLDAPLERRKQRLRDALREGDRVRYAAHIEADGVDFCRAAAAHGLEGVMAKHRLSRYVPGRRSPAWRKLKFRPQQDLVLVGYVPGAGTAGELGALLTAVSSGRELEYAGRVGSGLDARARAALRAALDGLARPDAPTRTAPRLANARWAEPRLVIRASVGGWTRDGLVRQAAFSALLPDRQPAAATREPAPVTRTEGRAPSVTRHWLADPGDLSPDERRGRPESHVVPAQRPPAGGGAGASSRSAASGPPVGTKAPPPVADDREIQESLQAIDALGQTGRWTVQGRTIALSNLERALFPADGITKRELLRYYVWIAPVLLPHLAGRAVNLHRFPNGIAEAGFWQHALPAGAPPWLPRTAVPGAAPGSGQSVIVVEDAAALAWAANLGTIDLHPATARLEDPTHPSYALVDIDPGDATPFADVLVIARLYRGALDHLGLRAFPKLSGQAGIQLWIPVAPVYTFEQTRTWVERLSRIVGGQVPELVSWEWEIARRGGRARLDYTQNAAHKTLVAPYAVRPVAGAPVSTPLRWEELDDPTLRPQGWTIRTLPERMAAVGDLFAEADTVRQELPPLA